MKQSIKEKFNVKSIDTYLCKDWLLNKHYAKRIPSISYSFGLYDENNILHGVCCFGFSVSCIQLEKMFKPYNIIELVRLVINDNMPKNTLSYFVSNSINLLNESFVIVSYADKEQNHHGYIYQATNWIYTGLGAGGKKYAVKGLEHLHPTAIEDSVGRYDKNVGNKLEKLKNKYGDKLYLKKLSEKYRYFYFKGNKKEKKEMLEKLKYKILTYPKGDNIRYDASYQPNIQTELF
jgi:hypothetical protein